MKIVVAVLSFCLLILIPVAAQADYSIEAELDPQAHTIHGSELVRYYNGSETEMGSLYFLLLPNFGREKNPYLDSSYIDQQYWSGFEPSRLEIGAVTGPEGEQLQYSLEKSPPELQTYSLEETILRVELSEPLPPGQTASVRIEFTTKFPHMIVGDQSYHRDIYTWRFGWNPIALPPSELIDGHYFAEEKEYYKFELPAARYEAELTLPKDYVLAAGAAQQTLLSEEGDQKTLLLRSAVPVRSLPISAGPGFKVYRLEAPVAIEVYYLPGSEGAARLIATYAAEILGRYQELYGPYGYKRLVIVESSAQGWFGMAADGFVILGNSAFREKDLALVGLADRLLEYLLAHEIAHQWWGIGVGADFNAENFLSEGLAQYLSITYFEEKYGQFGPNVFVFERPGLLEQLVEHQLGFYNLRQHGEELPYLTVFKDGFDEAIIKPVKDVEYLNASGTRIYSKGYLVLRALAGQLGREAMTELLRRAYGRFNHKIVTVEELQRLAEEVSGRALQGFFHDWLYAAEFVDYGIKGVETVARDGQYSTEISLTKRGGASLPVEVIAVTEGGEEIKRMWDAKKTEEALKIESGSPVKEVRVDPRELTPDVNRLDNFYPPKLRVITTGRNDLPLDAYLLRFDPATQTLEGGTLWHRWLLGQGIGAFAVYNGRGSTARGYLDLRPLDKYGTIAGELELDLTRFSNPEVGSPAKFWEPTDWLRFSVGRTLDTAQGSAREITADRDISRAKGINYLGITWLRSEAISDRYSFSAELLGYPFQFARLSLGSWHRFRLMPHLYLEEEVMLGLGYNLAQPFRFDLDELKSFYRKEGEEWLKESFPGEVKLAGRLALSLPVRRELDYDLANLAVIDEVVETVFLAGGQTWEGLEGLDFGGLKLEAGVEAAFLGRTLGGLFPINFTVGFAYPLLGVEPENRRGQIYLGVQLPLL